MYIIYTFKKLLKNCSKCVTGTANEDNSMAKHYEKHHSCRYWTVQYIAVVTEMSNRGWWWIKKKQFTPKEKLFGIWSSWEEVQSKPPPVCCCSPKTTARKSEMYPKICFLHLTFFGGSFGLFVMNERVLHVSSHCELNICQRDSESSWPRFWYLCGKKKFQM